MYLDFFLFILQSIARTIVTRTVTSINTRTVNSCKTETLPRTAVGRPLTVRGLTADRFRRPCYSDPVHGPWSCCVAACWYDRNTGAEWSVPGPGNSVVTKMASGAKKSAYY